MLDIGASGMLDDFSLSFSIFVFLPIFPNFFLFLFLFYTVVHWRLGRTVALTRNIRPF